MKQHKRKAAKPVQRNESDKQSRAWWQAIDRAAATAPRLVDKPKRKRKVAKPVWRSGRPTREGWYWLAIRGHLYQEPVRVWEADDVLWQNYDSATDLEGFDREDGVLLWCGPLPTPPNKIREVPRKRRARK